MVYSIVIYFNWNIVKVIHYKQFYSLYQLNKINLHFTVITVRFIVGPVMNKAI